MLAVAVLVVGATAARANPGDRKGGNNILFLFSDEMDGRILDPASPQLKPPLPNLERLAGRGAVFTRAYAQSPQCVPSRSALMVGLRTDQIEVWDNFLGIASTNGKPTNPDTHCVSAFGYQNCVDFGKSQNAPPTFIDHLAAGGYNVTLYGKMHVGAGLSDYPGLIGEFPFSNPSNSSDPKCLREWTRGLGPHTNVKGKTVQVPNLNVPDTVPKPALAVDYATLTSCVDKLRGGLIHPGGPAQFLYCSIIVPHPPYASNKTYMDAVEKLAVNVPEQVPLAQLHPNDVSTALLKSSLGTDNVSATEVIHFRRVYFSMCFEADSILGQIIDALDDSGARDQTYVLMISDHGEDAVEHRQTGKNNMYDSATRVAMLLSGPGIAAGQTIPTLTSLSDVFPTVLDMAGIAPPPGLAGSSILPLADGSGDPHRPDFITAQYHSVFSVTGEFMIRQGNLKLIVYGKNQFDWQYPPQLFDLEADPWELRDIAANSTAVVARLTAMLDQAMGGSTAAIDARAKAIQRDLFTRFSYLPNGGAAGCQKLFGKLYGAAFNASDAAKVATWLGEPCPWTPPPPPGPPDPTCQHGIKDADGIACCAASCGVCAHPSEECDSRPGGATACCPSVVHKSDPPCSTHAAPCALGPPTSPTAAGLR
mmetsp:Transcript_34491/g.104057  ORF Transcript_34491/g.104057 Transcript_34491/m.104057 type:complete len:648 (+) Transcript_34491:104-2047(+)